MRWLRSGDPLINRQRALFLRRAAALVELHDLGRTNRQVRELLRLNHIQIAKLCRHASIKLAYDKTGWNPGATKARAGHMVELYQAGYTLEAIGKQFGVTRERARQLMTKHFGIRAQDGGQSIRAERRRAAAQARRERDCLTRHGCTLEQLEHLRQLGREHMENGGTRDTAPINAFNGQKHNAGNRGIGWNLLLWQWWTIWQESGHWAERGRGHGYMMCRIGDTGAYEPGNVYIATGVHNGSVQPNNPYRRSHPDFERVMAARALERRSEAA